LHGGGGNEREHGRVADLLGRDGVIYVAVRAPFANSRTSFLAWPPDEYPAGSPVWDALRTDYSDWIADVIKAVRKEFRVRSRSTFIEGYSEGGEFATLTALLHPDMVNGYFTQSGAPIPVEWFTSERLARMKHHGVTAWIVHGLSDPTVPVDVAIQLAKRLQVAGIPVSLYTLEGTHAVSGDMFKLEQQWVREVVGEGKSGPRSRQ
jgi:predicted esterase